MPRDDYEEDVYDEELDDELEEGEEEREEVDERVAGMSAWGISITLHALALLLIGLIVIAADLVTDKAPVKLTQLDEPPPEEEKEKPRDLIEKPDTRIDSDIPVENPVITDLDLPVEETMTEDPVEESDKAKGREEAVSTSEMASNGAFMAIGAGGGAAGAFGSRTGGGKKRAIGRFGGTRGSESAVEAALRWFAIHQSPNGQWDVDGYQANCQEAGPKCEPGSNQSGNADAACTGYALLCYLGAGYDHRHMSKWRKVVKGGIDWLVANQQADGSWGRNYENGICTMAVAEAYALSGDGALREPAQKAVDNLLARQTPGGGEDAAYGGLGWDYNKPNPSRMDSSVSGWCVMGLKSAKAAGLDVQNGLAGAKNWLEGAWKASNPGWESLDPYGESVFPYTWNMNTDECNMHEGRLVCVGALCAVFLGLRQGEVMLDTMINKIMSSQVPAGYPCNTYFMYYNTLSVFQFGGKQWEQWNNTVRDMLVQAQRRDPECFNGSWDYEGTEFHGHNTGRLLSTAYCCLSLEVYYRYLPIAAGGGGGGGAGKMP